VKKLDEIAGYENIIRDSNIQSVGVIDVSTMEEQVEPLENVVSSACSSLPVSEHHKSEKNFRNNLLHEILYFCKVEGTGLELWSVVVHLAAGTNMCME
jgi:hypothetical protein